MLCMPIAKHFWAEFPPVPITCLKSEILERRRGNLLVNQQVWQTIHGYKRSSLGEIFPSSTSFRDEFDER